MRKLALLTAAIFLLAASQARAQAVQLVPFGGQNFADPRFVAAPPGDASRLFVVQSAGAIRLVKDGVTQPAPFLDINADVHDTCGECGMGSMAFASDYATSGLFYVMYTRDVNPGFHHLRVEEWRRSAANPDVADPASRRILLEIPHLGAENHNGGQLQVGPDKLLYIWTGDGGGGQSANAQNPASLLGKILRINPRAGTPYAIPSDNPFGNEVYSYGLRNPWRGSFDRSTGDLTTGDVGQGTWEELDFKLEGGGRGANFGWDCFEGLSTFGACSAPNHSPPVHQYANTGNAAVAGGYVIRDPALPGHAGRYIYADTFTALGNQIRTINLGAGSGSDAPLGLTMTNVASFGQDACGHIYLVGLGGAVQRLQPTGGPFPCKLAPDLTANTTKSTARAAKTGGLEFEARCDEDCDLAAEAVVELGGSKKKKKGKSARKKRKKKRKPTLVTQALSVRLQLGTTQRFTLELSKKQAKRLRKTLARGKRVVARIEVSATGGGGGTETVSLKAKQRLGKGKKKRRSKD